MHTVKLKGKLKAKAVEEVKTLKKFWTYDYTPIVADLGANIGYYTEVLLSEFEESLVYSYEPHPENLKHLTQLSSDRLTVLNYGLLDKDSELEIGLPVNKADNNGCYSILHTTNSVKVQLKNADKESIQPDVVKIDVEGSEPLILKCSRFFQKTKLILIEIVKDDPMKINSKIKKGLEELGFEYKKNVSKNNQIWIRKYD